MNLQKDKNYKKLCKEASKYCCWIHINPKKLQWICTSEKANRGIIVNRKICKDCLIKNKNSLNSKWREL